MDHSCRIRSLFFALPFAALVAASVTGCSVGSDGSDSIDDGTSELRKGKGGSKPGNPGGQPGQPPQTCAAPDGTSVPVGKSILGPDGCNECTCTAQGLACTEMACAEPPTCVDSSGQSHKVGENFKDDCNTCTCTTQGAICTAIGCNPPPPPSNGDCTDKDGKVYPEGTSWTNGCQTCSCTTQGILCTMQACALDCSAKGACGPSMGMPNELCADGTVAGPICVDVGGQCGWKITTCK